MKSNYEKLAAELTELHFQHSKEMAEFQSKVSTKGEERVLLYLLKKKDIVFPSELSLRLNLTTGRMANILNALEKKKYIFREKSGTDKRKVQVRLTKAGEVYIVKIFTNILRRHESILEQMGEKDSMEFVRLIKKLVYIAEPYLEMAD